MSGAGEAKETLRLFSLHSQKGGVGKTSIAIAIAEWTRLIHSDSKVEFVWTQKLFRIAIVRIDCLRP